MQSKQLHVSYNNIVRHGPHGAASRAVQVWPSQCLIKNFDQILGLLCSVKLLPPMRMTAAQCSVLILDKTAQTLQKMAQLGFQTKFKSLSLRTHQWFQQHIKVQTGTKRVQYTHELSACICQPASHSLDQPFLDESIYATLRDRVMKILIQMIRQTYQSVQAIGWTDTHYMLY